MKFLSALFVLLLGLMSSCSEVESLYKEDVHYQENHDPSLSSGPEVGWLYKEDVQYQENHDPSRIFLIDGRILFMTCNNISWQEIENWKKGKLLHIAYRTETGSVLLDPLSGKYIPIKSGLTEHPLSVLMDKRGDRGGSTRDMVNWHIEFEELWRQDMNRSHSELLEAYSSYLEDMDRDERKSYEEGKQNLIVAQQKWIEFRDAESLAVGMYYGAWWDSGKHGSFSQVECAMENMILTSVRASDLASLLLKRMGDRRIEFTELEEQDMNRSHSELLGAYSSYLEDMDRDERKSYEEGKQNLIVAQQKWIEFRDAESLAVGMYYGAARDSGNLAPIARVESERNVIRLTARRAKHLEGRLYRKIGPANN